MVASPDAGLMAMPAGSGMSTPWSRPRPSRCQHQPGAPRITVAGHIQPTVARHGYQSQGGGCTSILEVDKIIFGVGLVRWCASEYRGRLQALCDNAAGPRIAPKPQQDGRVRQTAGA